VTSQGEAADELMVHGAAELLGQTVAAGHVKVSSGVRGTVAQDGSVSLTGTVAELETLQGIRAKLLPSTIERFVTEHAPLIQQACVLTSPEGDVVVVAVPDFEALYEIHRKRTEVEFKVSPSHLLADYTLRKLCEDQMNTVLERLRKDPEIVAPSAIPDTYRLVAEEFNVYDGTLSPAGLLEPRRDAIAQRHLVRLDAGARASDTPGLHAAIASTTSHVSTT